MSTTTAAATTAEQGFQINVTLTVIACCLIVAIALGMVGFLVWDRIKKKKERKEMEEEQANVEEAFSGPVQNNAAGNIYGVLWSKDHTKKEPKAGKAPGGEKIPLISKVENEAQSNKAAGSEKEGDEEEEQKTRPSRRVQHEQKI